MIMVTWSFEASSPEKVIKLFSAAPRSNCVSSIASTTLSGVIVISAATSFPPISTWGKDRTTSPSRSTAGDDSVSTPSPRSITVLKMFIFISLNKPGVLVVSGKLRPFGALMLNKSSFVTTQRPLPSYAAPITSNWFSTSSDNAESFTFVNSITNWSTSSIADEASVSWYRMTNSSVADGLSLLVVNLITPVRRSATTLIKPPIPATSSTMSLLVVPLSVSTTGLTTTLIVPITVAVAIPSPESEESTYSLSRSSTSTSVVNVKSTLESDGGVIWIKLFANAIWVNCSGVWLLSFGVIVNVPAPSSTTVTSPFTTAVTPDGIPEIMIEVKCSSESI